MYLADKIHAHNLEQANTQAKAKTATDMDAKVVCFFFFSKTLIPDVAQVPDPPRHRKSRYDTVVQLKCDARVSCRNIYAPRRPSCQHDHTLARGIPNGSHDRHLLEHKRKVCLLATVSRHKVVVSAVCRVRERPASATSVPVHDMTEKAARARGLSVEYADVLAKSYEDLLAETRWPVCSASPAPSVPPTEPWGRSVPVQIPKRLEALGLQPTSGACSSATCSSRSWASAYRPASVSVS